MAGIALQSCQANIAPAIRSEGELGSEVELRGWDRLWGL
jgi:hypothetical protein